jgi:NAD(P)-dependent dehydrogenase (short-subunit alcohol dehydrogenase family)
MSLEDRVVVIPGATGSLGKVVSSFFSNQGARLALIGRDAQTLDQLANDLNTPDDHILVHAANLVEPGEANNAANVVIERFGKVEIIINLIGGWTGGKTIEQDIVDEISQMLEQHLWSTYHLARAFVPHLKANGWGRFIVVSSPYAIRPKGGGAAYAIGKIAQETLILTLAQELKDTGVTANIIQVHAIDVKQERLHNPTPKNATWATPAEIASAMLYLCSESAQQVNGARIPLYGNL